MIHKPWLFFFFLTKQGKRGGGGKWGEAQANLVLTVGPPWMAEMSQLTAAMLNTRLPNLGRASQITDAQNDGDCGVIVKGLSLCISSPGALQASLSL